ncbi:NAD(P)/FAD-dependent oxidoreductase [Thermonema rossianum]|uniref:NAD(P)/FAD-dependent oxidoreductase n=1 Tax=Thermonema rossianum TaxID=55505 RepID=UPI000571145D|nr:NAD(P)/FAD-dependent oxidoreductase [Thermonema rossianum]
MSYPTQPVCLPDTNLPRLVVVGGGFAGMNLIKHLPKGRFQVVLIDKNNFHQFQPLLYQVASAGIEPDSIAMPLRKRFKGYPGFYFRMAEVLEIDAVRRRLITDIGWIAYDYLVIATGSETNYFGLHDVQANAIGMKSIRDALNMRSLILQNLEQAVYTCDKQEQQACTTFVVVGGGPAGVEMAGALAEFKRYILPADYPELHQEDMQIYLLEAGNRLLAGMSEKAGQKALKYLQDLGVHVDLGAMVQSYDGETVRIKDREPLRARTVIWTAGVKGSHPGGIPREVVGAGNRLLVDEYNRVKGFERIFAIGDVAAMVSDAYPKGHPMVAQPAIQQGRHLAGNLLRLLEGQPLRPFVYHDKGSMATVGKRKAVADIGKRRLAGRLAWWLWSVVHLLAISGFRNKLLVMLNWMWSYFTYEKGNRLIIRRYKPRAQQQKPAGQPET